MAEDRTEKATQYRRRRFRERGMVAHSRDLSAAVGLLTAFGALKLMGPWMASRLANDTVHFFVSASSHQLNSGTLSAYGLHAFKLLALLAAPPLTMAAVGSMAASWLQTGFLFSAFPLIPTLDRINPLNGLRRLFSWEGLFETIKSVAKICVLMAVAWLTLKPRVVGLIAAGLENPTTLAQRAATLASLLTLRCGLTMLVIGAADYAFQWWQMERRMMMTRQEAKEEWKETEGDPLLEMRRRARRNELLEQRITPELREASVVVTNPTHIAVALKYQLHQMPAPKVVAKGRGYVAERIVALARTYNIPVERNVPLARALYKSVRVGDYIPRALYRAVAEILAVVYRRREQRLQRIMQQRRRRS